MDIKVKQNAVKRQAQALDCDQYRISLMRDSVGRNFSNSGNENLSEERFFTVNDILDSIEKLRMENAKKWNVFITPIDCDHHYLVVDDVPTIEAVAEFKKLGYTPCLVQLSSKNSIQCILKIPKIIGNNEQKFANKLVVELNTKYGDKKFQGVIHPFRLAGFSNKKANRNDEFTKILETNNGVICSKAQNELEAIRSAFVAPINTQASKSPIQAVITHSKPSVDAQHSYITFRKGYEQACEKLGWNRDESLIDFKCAKEMMKEGYSQFEIANSIISLSPNLIERHPDFEYYASKVASNAFRF